MQLDKYLRGPLHAAVGHSAQVLAMLAEAGMPALEYDSTCVGQTSASGGADARYEAPSTDAVVCATCLLVSKNEHGHKIHCGKRHAGEQQPSVSFATFEALQKAQASKRAVDKLKSDNFVESQAAEMNAAYLDLQYHKMAPQGTLNACQALVERHVTAMKHEVMRRLGEGQSPLQVESLEAAIKDVFEVHKHLETPGQTETRVQPAPAHYRELIDKPDANGQPTGSRRGDHVYDVPICEGLKAILRDDPTVMTCIREAAAGWAEPTAGDSVTAFCDVSDGAVFRAHHELGVNADRSDGAVRLGFILYYDEVEVCNALGSFVGTHKIGLFYWALLNLPAHQRMDLCNIHLATVVLDADMSYYGAEQAGTASRLRQASP